MTKPNVMSDIERRIAKIWEKTLKVSPIGLHDDFFVIGGDSLAAVEVMMEVEEEFSIILDPVEILEASTISDLAKMVERCKAS